MKKELSILIPTFNDICVDLVQALARQCDSIQRLKYEIIVADDGSTNDKVKQRNSYINNINRCRYVLREQNTGRACIRNWLAQQAHYEWLLFVDSHMAVCKDDYIAEYLDTVDDVVYGGYVVKGDAEKLKGNLRYLYEKKAEPMHTAEMRIRSPHQDFHTSNFLVSRQVFINHPLDVRFRHYGYEDVLFGKQLQMAGISIDHISNPLAFDRFEDNARFMEKTEESLRTIYMFRDELRGYARLLDASDKLRQYRLHTPFLWIYRKMKNRWRRNLCGDKPSLLVFKLYKLGYYAELG